MLEIVILFLIAVLILIRYLVAGKYYVLFVFMDITFLCILAIARIEKNIFVIVVLIVKLS